MWLFPFCEIIGFLFTFIILLNIILVKFFIKNVFFLFYKIGDAISNWENMIIKFGFQLFHYH